MEQNSFRASNLSNRELSLLFTSVHQWDYIQYHRATPDPVGRRLRPIISGSEPWGSHCVIPLKTLIATESHAALTAHGTDPISSVAAMFSVTVGTKDTRLSLVHVNSDKEVLPFWLLGAGGTTWTTCSFMTLSINPDQASINTLSKLRAVHLCSQPSILQIDYECVHCKQMTVGH